MLSTKWDQRLEWVLPLKVTGQIEFTLFGMWSSNGRGGIRYPGETHEYPSGHLLEAYESLLDGDFVIAGDFNHHPQWDKGNPRKDFRTMLEGYRNVGLRSAWHSTNGVEVGDQSEPATHWHQYKEEHSYHIDYCFIPESWLDRVETVWVGNFEDYGAEKPRSDHAPMLVDVRVPSEV